MSGLLRPDTPGYSGYSGVPTNPDATPAPRADSGAPQWIDIAKTVPADAWIALAVLVALLIAVQLFRRRNRNSNNAGSSGGGFLDKAMTFFAAAVATGVVGTGMWAFFGDTLHITDPIMRTLLFAFFELGMLAEALRSRRFRLDRAQRAESARKEAENNKDTKPAPVVHEVDVDGIAVWILALMSGFFAATHETEMGAIGLRLVAPIIAAWLWERGIAGELRQFRRTPRQRKINLRLDLERVLVWLRIAEATAKDVDEVDRNRRRTAFVVAAYRLHTLISDNAHPKRVWFARWRLRRAGLAIMSLYGVAELHAARGDVAALYGIEHNTSPDAVGHLGPWESSQPLPGVRSATLAVDGQSVPRGSAVGTRPALTGAATAHAVAGAGENTTGGRPAKVAADRPAKTVTVPAGNPPVVVRSRVTAKPVEDLEPLGERARVTVDKLARAFARKPAGTHEELAKLARVSKGTADRWMPRVRAEAAAIDAAAAGEDESLSAGVPERMSANGVAGVLSAAANPLAVLPAPRPPVTSGTNGHAVLTAASEEDAK